MVIARIIDYYMAQNMRRISNWQVQFLRQPFGLFDRQGRRLGSVADVMKAQFVLLFEGGQFMWPPVRKGDLYVCM